MRRPQKLRKSSPSIWHYVVNVKSTAKIFLSLFVAFFKNMNLLSWSRKWKWMFWCSTQRFDRFFLPPNSFHDSLLWLASVATHVVFTSFWKKNLRAYFFNFCWKKLMQKLVKTLRCHLKEKCHLKLFNLLKFGLFEEHT